MIISEMQHKLATWATADPTRRFDRLLRLITDRNWLAEAARIVLTSRGSGTPGLDGLDGGPGLGPKALSVKRARTSCPG